MITIVKLINKSNTSHSYIIILFICLFVWYSNRGICSALTTPKLKKKIFFKDYQYIVSGMTRLYFSFKEKK